MTNKSNTKRIFDLEEKTFQFAKDVCVFDFVMYFFCDLNFVI